jgi:hypothetical protein
MHDDERQYHAAAAYVYIGRRAFTRDEIWSGVDAAQDTRIPLDPIGCALTYNWPAAITALALKNIATLRTLQPDRNA